ARRAPGRKAGLGDDPELVRDRRRRPLDQPGLAARRGRSHGRDDGRDRWRLPLDRTLGADPGRQGCDRCRRGGRWPAALGRVPAVADLGRDVLMSSANEPSNNDRFEPTLASTWQAVAGGPIEDGLLGWPPDVFALTDVILERAEAFRFALSPPDGRV